MIGVEGALCCSVGLGFGGRMIGMHALAPPPDRSTESPPTITPTRAQHKPQFLVAVPRLFETIYRGVQQKFATEKGVKKGLISFFTKVKWGGGEKCGGLSGLCVVGAGWCCCPTTTHCTTSNQRPTA